MARIDEQAAFEAQLVRPPHAARMMEHAGRYVKWLDKEDKHAVLTDALGYMFEERARIAEGRDVLKIWDEALEFAARKRPRWQCTDAWQRTRWIKGSRLGRD